MAKSLPSLHPNQLSFRDASSYIIFKLTQLSSQTPGNAPRGGNSSLMGAYPRALKMNKNNYLINAEGGFLLVHRGSPGNASLTFRKKYSVSR